mmetsp:Transcript_40332/g.83947  ORF Transcript_40332/g.83947 Transcript_40332/m.83947 type:complete len:301 (-) Transcript_40332:122-1024(-)
MLLSCHMHILKNKCGSLRIPVSPVPFQSIFLFLPCLQLSGVSCSSSFEHILLFLDILKRLDGLSLDTSCFHLRLELLGVANSREEVGLTSSIAIESSKITIPLPFRGFCFLEVANDGELFTGEESIVSDRVIRPSVTGTSDIVVRLLFQVGSIFQIQFGSLDVVEFECILFKDATNTKCLDPQKSSKQQMENTSGNTNNGRSAIWVIGRMIPNDQRTEDGNPKGQKEIGINHHVFHHLPFHPIDFLDGDGRGRFTLVGWFIAPIIFGLAGKRRLQVRRRRQRRDLCGSRSKTSSQGGHGQ